MIDVNHQISAVRAHGRFAGAGSRRGAGGHGRPVVCDRCRRSVGRLYQYRPDSTVVPAHHRRPEGGRPVPAGRQRQRHDPDLRPTAGVHRDLGVRRGCQLDRGARHRSRAPTRPAWSWSTSRTSTTTPGASSGRARSGIGWDLGTGRAGDPPGAPGESLDPTFGQQWTATEDGRRFMSLSSEAWFDAERRRSGQTPRRPGPARIGARRPTSREA